MPKLLLDMGNSRLKSAVLSEARQLTEFVFKPYDGLAPIEILGQHLDSYALIESVTMVSVLGDEFHQQTVKLLKQRDVPLRWVASEANSQGVINNYRRPTQLGSDRFVALVAARKAFPAECCVVVDCGTAVTVDALNARGEFCGGVIIPGLKLWSDSLIKRAGQLNEHQIEDTELFARDTAQAIGSGSIFGLTSAIEGISLRMTKQLEKSNQANTEVMLIICGGDAELVGRYSYLKFELMPHLVLMGLAEYT